MISQPTDDLDQLGDIGVYLPEWRFEALLARFADRIGNHRRLDGWSDDLNSLRPRWISLPGAELSLACAHALVGSWSDSHLKGEPRRKLDAHRRAIEEIRRSLALGINSSRAGD